MIDTEKIILNDHPKEECTVMKKKNMYCAVLTASAVMALGLAFTSFAAGWEQKDSEWVYVQNNGDCLKSEWKLDGDKYYYLGSDGYMVRNTLLEDNDNYYYLNSAGVMTTNDWKFIQNPEWQGDSLAGEGSWYYFGNNGKAIRSDGNKAKVYSVGNKKFVFDHYGRMMTGWVTEAGEYVEDEADWANGMYYADGSGDGSIVTNAWVYTSVPDDSNEDDTEPTYHFYFGSNGKKNVSGDKTVGNKKYHFDERGVAVSGWRHEDAGWKYYGDSEDPSLHTGWFQAIPASDLDSSGHDDGSTYWYYAGSSGLIAMSEFKSLDGKIYALDNKGELVTGLKKVTMEDGSSKKIASVDDIDYLADVEDITDSNTFVFLFGSDGAVKTGTQSVSLDGTNYTFEFRSGGTPKGAGANGAINNYFYKNGRRLCAESGSKYSVIEYNDKEYLVNESGAIQKNKKNVTDSDGYYYCTDSKGVLRHGRLSDKCTEKHK